MDLLSTLAVEVIPAQALSAIFGVGLKEATNWSLRAANKRTTLLLVWDDEDKEENKGVPKYRGNRGGKRRRRETEPRRDTPPPPPKISEEPAPKPPKQADTVQEGKIQGLTDKIEILAHQLQCFMVQTEDAATSPLQPERSTPPPPSKG